MTVVPALPTARRAPWPGGEVTSGGVTLHVRETPGPDGVPAVYVHGLSGSATNWTDVAGLLGPRAAGTAVDLPGFGLSRPPEEFDYSAEAHADALLCFLAGRGKPVHLLGNSFGGAMAVDVAARRPELVATLTLVSPAMPDRRLDPRRISDPRLALAMMPIIGRRAKAQLAALTAMERAEQVVRLCFGDPAAVPAYRLAEAAEEILVRGRLPWAQEASMRTASAMIASWARGRLWTRATRVRAPALVIWGDRDRLVSPRLAARTVAALPDARLLMLPGVGHVAQMEAPGVVARAVGELWDGWVAGRERAGSGENTGEDPARPARCRRDWRQP